MPILEVRELKIGNRRRAGQRQVFCRRPASVYLKSQNLSRGCIPDVEAEDAVKDRDLKIVKLREETGEIYFRSRTNGNFAAKLLVRRLLIPKPE